MLGNIIVDCQPSHVFADEVAIEGGPNTKIESNIIRNTRMIGIASYDISGAATVGSNTIKGNVICNSSPTGIVCGSSVARITDNVIAGSSRYGIDILPGARARIENNIIAGHSWGAINCDNADASINNTVLVTDSWDIIYSDGAIISMNSTIDITNSVFVDRRPGGSEISGLDGSRISMKNNLLSGGTGAPIVDETSILNWDSGKVDTDPLFLDMGQWSDPGTPWDPNDDTFILGDYHLLPGSPCIDAGANDVDNPDTPEIETLPATDISGLPRMIDGDLDGTATVDVGAYEYLPGDVNYDGKVNVLDLLLVRTSLGRDPASSIEARKADVNADGAVNVEDLIAVRGRLGR